MSNNCFKNTSRFASLLEEKTEVEEVPAKEEQDQESIPEAV
jgi:hypothetical protein